MLDLGDPLLLDVVERVGRVDGEADEDDVRVRVGEGSESVVVLLSGGIPERQLDALAIDDYVCDLQPAARISNGLVGACGRRQDSHSSRTRWERIPERREESPLVPATVGATVCLPRSGTVLDDPAPPQLPCVGPSFPAILPSCPLTVQLPRALKYERCCPSPRHEAKKRCYEPRGRCPWRTRLQEYSSVRPTRTREQHTY